MSTGATRRTTRTTRRATKGGSGGGSASSFKAAFILVVAVIVIFGGFVIGLNIQHQKEKEAEEAKLKAILAKNNVKIQLVVAKKNLSKGTEITFDTVELKDFPKGTSIVGSFTTTSDPKLTNKFVKTYIPAGQVILINNIQSMPVEEKLPLMANEIEIKVPITTEEQEAYYLKQGNYLTVYSQLVTASGNRIIRPISKHARLLMTERVAEEEPIITQAVGKATNAAPAISTNSPEPENPFVFLGLSPAEARMLTQELQDNRDIKFLPEGENPPPSTAAILQVWTGVEMEEKEVMSSIGSTIIDGGDVESTSSSNNTNSTGGVNVSGGSKS